MSATYIEIDFQIGNQRQLKDILIAELSEIEFESFMDHENGFLAYVQADLFNQTAFENIIAQQEKEVNYEVKTIAPQNWNAAWEAQFDPILIGDKCVIRAPFHPAFTDGRIELIIEPKMSFGTGHHATTRMMCEVLFKMEVQHKNVLDMGCGTGILGILSAKLGANSVIGIDIETWAIENSIENAERNNVTMSAFVGVAANIPSGPFDIILANINRNILVNDGEAYVKVLTPNGILAVSGFLETDEGIILSHFKEQGLIPINIKKEENWRCIVFQNDK